MPLYIGRCVGVTQIEKVATRSLLVRHAEGITFLENEDYKHCTNRGSCKLRREKYRACEPRLLTPFGHGLHVG